MLGSAGIRTDDGVTRSRFTSAASRLPSARSNDAPDRPRQSRVVACPPSPATVSLTTARCSPVALSRSDACPSSWPCAEIQALSPASSPVRVSISSRQAEDTGPPITKAADSAGSPPGTARNYFTSAERSTIRNDGHGGHIGWTCCEHVFVTSQGSPSARFQRALATGNPTIATAAAAELGSVPLADALALVLIYRDAADRRFERAAVRWHGRLCLELRPL